MYTRIWYQHLHVGVSNGSPHTTKGPPLDTPKEGPGRLPSGLTHAGCQRDLKSFVTPCGLDRRFGWSNHVKSFQWCG